MSLKTRQSKQHSFAEFETKRTQVMTFTLRETMEKDISNNITLAVVSISC